MPSYGIIEIQIRSSVLPQIPVALIVGPTNQIFEGHAEPGLLPWTPVDDPQSDGDRLFDWLFSNGELRLVWQETRKRFPACRVRIRIENANPALHDIPWENLREVLGDGVSLEIRRSHIAAARATPFARALRGDAENLTQPLPSPLKILVAVADPPMDSLRLNVEEELEVVYSAIKGLNVEIVLVEQPCSHSSLEQGIRKGCHIVHFVGHGAVDDNRLPFLFLPSSRDPAAEVEAVYGDHLALMIQRLQPESDMSDQIMPRLFMLAGCRTATQGTRDAYRGFAPSLIDAGVPAVVAMQGDVRGRYGASFQPHILRTTSRPWLR